MKVVISVVDYEGQSVVVDELDMQCRVHIGDELTFADKAFDRWDQEELLCPDDIARLRACNGLMSPKVTASHLVLGTDTQEVTVEWDEAALIQKAAYDLVDAVEFGDPDVVVSELKQLALVVRGGEDMAERIGGMFRSAPAKEPNGETE